MSCKCGHAKGKHSVGEFDKIDGWTRTKEHAKCKQQNCNCKNYEEVN